MKIVLLKKIDSLSAIFKINFRYVFKNSFWVFLEQLTSLFFGIIIIYVTANFISPEILGQYKYILSLAAIVSLATLSGMGYSLTREIVLGNDSFFVYAFSMAFRWSIFPIFLSVIISTYYFYNNNYIYAIGIMLATFFSVMLNNFNLYRAYLLGKEDFKSISLYGSVILLVNLITTAATFYLFKDINLLIVGTLGVQCLFTSIFYFYTRLDIVSTGLNLDTINKFKNYVYSQSIVNFFSIGSSHLDKIVLFQILGPKELAIYLFVTVIVEKIRGVFKSIGSIVYPKFVKIDTVNFKLKFFKISLLFLFLLFAIFVVLVSILPILYDILLPNYTQYSYLAMIYAISIFSVLAVFPYSLMQAQNFKKELYTFEVYNSGLSISMTILGSIYFGLFGAVMGRALSGILGTVGLYIQIYSKKYE